MAFSSLTLMWSPSGSGRRQQVLLGQDRDLSQVIADVGPDVDEVSVSEALLEPGQMFYQIREDGGYASPVRSFVVPRAEVAAETFQTSYTLLPGEVIAVRPLIYPGADDFAYVSVERTSDDLREDAPQWEEVSRTTVPGGLLSVQARSSDRGYRIAVYGERVGKDTTELLFTQASRVMVIGGAPPVGVNNPPWVVAPLPDQSLNVGDPVVEINLLNHFADPDGDSLEFSVGSAPGVSVTGSTLRISTAQAVSSRTVAVIATDPGGALISDTFALAISPVASIPTAAFTRSVSGLTVSFNDASTDADGTIEAWSWTFGDGSGSTEQNPQHTYSQEGTYTVVLTVTDDSGTQDTASATVTVAPITPPPGDDLQLTLNANTSGDPTVLFGASPSGGTAPYSFAWDFGDGSISSQQNPQHTYQSNGAYTVTCTVTDDDGEELTRQTAVNIFGIGPNVGPTASFSYTSPNLVASFTDTSVDPDGTIVAWSWDFGDGGSSSQRNPQHTYGSQGTYTVTLTVTDNQGAQGTVSVPISIPRVINEPPEASFVSAVTDLTVLFTDTSTDSDGTIDAWLWDFGDGTGNTVPNPEHTYASAGIYTVTLTVTDDDGAQDTFSSDVTVTEPANQPPVADISPSATSVGSGDTVTLDGTGSSDPDGSVVAYDWELDAPPGSVSILVGDGTDTASFSASVPGTYTVRLVVTDDDGAQSAEASVDISVVDSDASNSTIGAIVQSPNPAIYGNPASLTIPNRTGVEPATVTWYTLEGDEIGSSSSSSLDFETSIGSQYTYLDNTVEVVVEYPDGSTLTTTHELNLDSTGTTPTQPGSLDLTVQYDQGDVPLSLTTPTQPGSISAAIGYDQADVPIDAPSAPTSPGSVSASFSYDQTDVPT